MLANVDLCKATQACVKLSCQWFSSKRIHDYESVWPVGGAALGSPSRPVDSVGIVRPAVYSTHTRSRVRQSRNTTIAKNSGWQHCRKQRKWLLQKAKNDFRGTHCLPNILYPVCDSCSLREWRPSRLLTTSTNDALRTNTRVYHVQQVNEAADKLRAHHLLQCTRRG